MEEPAREELEAAGCWEASDRVPADPVTTAFRRAARLHQARWREAHGHPAGTQPLNPKPGRPSRTVGSRLPTGYARETGAAFLTPTARAAAEARTALTEPHQTFDRQRLWADLLWAPALAVNVFAGVDDATVHRWWPDAPGTLAAVRFEHSPGRLDPAYLGNLSSFAAALELDLGGDGRGIVGVRALYADEVKRETPKPRNLPRYREVAERSGVFAAGAIPDGAPSDLTEIWLDHLLVLAMLQHPGERWRWGRMVLLHPGGHARAADAAARYRALLGPDDTTFATLVLEEALTTPELAERYRVG